MKHVQVATAGNIVPGIGSRRAASLVADYLALTKPRLNFLVVATSAAGYYLGAAAPIDPRRMVAASIGTALVAGGAAVLNQVSERDTDALMRRTRLRPLPDRRVGPDQARIFGLLLAASGLVLLAAHTGFLAAALAFGTIAIYLALYTPMKRRTPLATVVGAVPGALPALIGWAASRGTIASGGIVLFAIVFLWQIPHFMAISWLYRDDYGKAGFPMLTVIDPGGHRAGCQAMLSAAALVPVTLLPALTSLAGAIYAIAAAVLGIALLWLAFQFAQRRTDDCARRLFFGSILYLPMLWIVMIADKL